MALSGIDDTLVINRADGLGPPFNYDARGLTYSYAYIGIKR